MGKIAYEKIKDPSDTCSGSFINPHVCRRDFQVNSKKSAVKVSPVNPLSNVPDHERLRLFQSPSSCPRFCHCSNEYADIFHTPSAPVWRQKHNMHQLLVSLHSKKGQSGCLLIFMMKQSVPSSAAHSGR